MAKVSDISEAKVRPLIEEMGYELLDVEYKKEFDGMSLIFTIDSENGVTIDVSLCTECGLCKSVCKFGAIEPIGGGKE